VAQDWTAVIPVKPLDSAKSRLRGAVPAGRHADLALALVRDTVAAVLACPAVREVLVVTDDPGAARAATALGARVEPDRPDAGLNAAVRFGADIVAGVTRPRAALAADLPALRPGELAAALALARRRSFVADAEGSGTVLLAAPPGVPLDPRFGAGSAAAHAASGAQALTGDWPGLRRDVDTAADLQTVMELGVGPCTSQLMRSPVQKAIAAERSGASNIVASMQGTVATYDPGTQAGTLLLDDGSELAFPPEAFRRSGLRLLRSGQRVTVETDTAGAVERLRLPGLD
jgi:2-phospho-L-lactate guanylyltransferase